MTKRKTPAARRPLRLEWVEAGSLADNPDNWRRHPRGQMAALKGMIDDVGWAGALLYNETTGRLIDGHARKNAVGPQTIVPVLVGRWTSEQEKRILSTLDPLAAMAEADGDALESLLADVDLSGRGLEELAALLDGLTEPEAPPPAKAAKKAATARQKGPKTVGITIGTFSFTAGRQQYDAWLSAVEAKVGPDADQVIKEIKRRLKIA
jgi:hypothetical protein